jgi:hypothetical protein
MTSLNKLEHAVRAFEKLQEKYQKLGADDTEPDAVFQVLLVKAMKGKKPFAPTAPDKWQLYSGKAGAKAAAEKMATAANDCIAVIEAVPIGESGEVREWLEDYCWRVDW